MTSLSGAVLCVLVERDVGLNPARSVVGTLLVASSDPKSYNYRMNFIYGPRVFSANVTQPRHFWDAFWPAIWAGLVTGVVAGLIVGLVVLLAQRVADKRRFRRACEIEWSSMKGRLASAVIRPSTVSADSLATLPSSVGAIDELVADKPISLWASELPGELAIGQVLALQTRRDDFVSAADELEQAIYQAVREKNQGSFGYDTASLRYLRGLVYGQSHEQAKLHVGPTDPPDEYLQGVAEILDKMAIVKLKRSYKRSRARLTANLTALKSALVDTRS